MVQLAGHIYEKYSQKVLIRKQLEKLEKSAEIFRNPKKMLVGLNPRVYFKTTFRGIKRHTIPNKNKNEYFTVIYFYWFGTP